MSKIKPLSAHTIQLIAAGEVIERPAHIVKELVENSLDAGAKHITVNLNRGGLERISIQDDGEGMDEVDLALAILPHTTSKLRSEQDLLSLSTLGFRGEALASLAYVAQVAIQTRPANQKHGWRLTVEPGESPSPVEPVGVPLGTTITISHLFGTLPARRKFLAQPATELRHITRQFVGLALGHPNVSFTLIHDNKTVLSLPTHPNWFDRVSAVILPTKEKPGLTPTASSPAGFFSSTQAGFGVTGWISPPSTTRRSSVHQYWLVNRRLLTATPMAKLLKDITHRQYTPRSEPEFVIALSLPTGLVDINTHPRKATVAFMEEAKIWQLIRQQIEAALATPVTPATPLPTPVDQPTSQPVNKPTDQSAPLRYSELDLHSKPGKNSSPLRLRDSSPLTHAQLSQTWSWQPADTNSSDPSILSPSDIVQLHRSYLLIPTKQGFQLIDQHAAHERILFEAFKQQYQKLIETTPTSSFPLTPPVVITLPLLDYQIAVEQLETLARLGFGLEPFGQNSLRLTQLPVLLKDRPPQQLLAELIDDLHQGRPVTGVDTLAEKTMAYLACRQAIKAGDHLTPPQRLELITKWQSTSNRATCPHGRPVLIEVTLSELEKWFKRK